MSDPSGPSYEDQVLEQAINPREKPMGFLQHIDELRVTLIKSAVAYIVCVIAVSIFLKQFNSVILWPLHTVQLEKPDLHLDLAPTSITEGFSIAIQLCALGGLIPAMPIILYFFGQFVAPALTERELKLVLPGSIAGGILFCIGAGFAYFLLVPSTIRVSAEINEYFGWSSRWTPDSYYGVLTWLTLGVGVAFEFPLLLVVLVHLGLLSVKTLKKYRRHAIVFFFFVAAVVTPTPDPMTQTIFAVPLCLLFEIALFVGARVERKRERRLAGQS